MITVAIKGRIVKCRETANGKVLTVQQYRHPATYFSLYCKNNKQCYGYISGGLCIECSCALGGTELKDGNVLNGIYIQYATLAKKYSELDVEDEEDEEDDDVTTRTWKNSKYYGL